jgi:hypothetical protein
VALEERGPPVSTESNLNPTHAGCGCNFVSVSNEKPLRLPSYGVALSSGSQPQYV